MSPSERHAPRGITNKQAKFLASLQREAGEPYSGSGLSKRGASSEIARLLRELGRDIPLRPVRRHRSQQRLAAVEAAPKKTARQMRAETERRAYAAANQVSSRADRDQPTETQLHDLAVLARRAGEPPPQPSHRGDAARELARLRSASP